MSKDSKSDTVAYNGAIIILRPKLEPARPKDRLQRDSGGGFAGVGSLAALLGLPDLCRQAGNLTAAVLLIKNPPCCEGIARGHSCLLLRVVPFV
jgi:hypothetical protein